MSKTKKVFKVIGNILLLLLLLFVIFLVVMFAVHKHLSKKDFDTLSEAGYVNLVQSKDCKLNVCSYGNEDGEHKFVALSGCGVNDYSVNLRKVTDEFADDNLIIFLDRAGYGLSEDTSLEMTAENVVENCRTALKNAGFEAPYVLMPHSLGGAYATYWESKYPEEIEGVVFIDCTELKEDSTFDEYDSEPYSPVSEAAQIYACKLGLHRLALHKYWYLLPESFSEEEQELSDALNSYRGYSKCVSNEYRYINDICSEAYNSIVTNDIPKVYICASWGLRTREDFDEYWEWVNTQSVRNNLEVPNVTDEEYEQMAEKILEQANELTDTILMPYLELMGNCECVNVPGDHFIYEQKPEECVEVIKEFLKKL